MQLWETFMWWDQKCGKLNEFGTRMAYIALWSHTLAIGVGLYIEEGIILPLAIGLAFMAVALINSFYINWKCSKPQKGNCHLVWGFPHEYYVYVFAVCMAIALVVIKPIWKALVIMIFFLASFVLSFIYAKNSTGSFWCFICAAFAPIFIAINS